MSDIRSLFERILSGNFVQPTVTTSAAEFADPSRKRRNFSALLGITAVTPEESPKKGDESPAPSPAVGTDHPKGNE